MYVFTWRTLVLIFIQKFGNFGMSKKLRKFKHFRVLYNSLLNLQLKYIIVQIYT